MKVGTVTEEFTHNPGPLSIRFIRDHLRPSVVFLLNHYGLAQGRSRHAHENLIERIRGGTGYQPVPLGNLPSGMEKYVRW
jgi:hypothetical protein